MAATEANAIDISTSGIVCNTGTAFTSTTTTAHNVLIGGASNYQVANVAPSSTSGVALISQGASSDPTFGTVAIAGGGTNATSFTQSNGIVTYNGTSLVNYAGPQINSSGRMTNTSQPAFLAYLANNQAGVTGDGTDYQIPFDSVSFDQTSSFTTGASAQFTVPVTGAYMFTGSVSIQGIGAGQTDALVHVFSNGVQFQCFRVNPINTIGGTLIMPFSLMPQRLSSTQVVTFKVQVSGGTKSVQVNGNGSAFITFVSGFLVC